MLDPSAFREIVSGARRGLPALLARGLLRLVETPYTAVVRRRNARFDSGKTPVHRIDAAVVSVGNLTLGGTGKTPMVRWLAQWFVDRGAKVAILSRGYGSRDGRPNDEALELAAKLPEVDHYQNPDRVAAAREAIDRSGAEVIVLDDAFQHRRIARDLDIVLIDALEPFGFGHVFPRGTLREPVAGLARADVVALSRCDMLDAERRESIRQEAARLAPRAIWLEVSHRPSGLLAGDGTREPIESLRGRRVAAFCGIGNPAGFRHTLGACGADVAGFRPLADHHAYTDADLTSLAAWVQSLDAVERIVCTHKDLVKIDRIELAGRPLHAVTIGLAFSRGQERLEQQLSKWARRENS